MSREARPRKRILCYINHFFGTCTPFHGKSTTQVPSVREGIVRKTIEQILKCRHKVDLHICGVGDHAALLPLNLIFAPADPRELVFETIEAMAQHVGEYDYFLNLEDDIHLPSSTIENAIAFDEKADLTDIFHPNRMEAINGESYCVDLRAMGGWTEFRREYNGRVVGVASNRHSGLMFLSREKFLHAAGRVDLSFRGPCCAGDLMASAYWHVHEPFQLCARWAKEVRTWFITRIRG